MFIDDQPAVEHVLEVNTYEAIASKLDFFQEDISLDEPKAVEYYLKELLDRKIDSVEELEEWMEDEHELMKKIGEVISGDSIAFQRYNDDPEIKERYEHDQQVIIPLLQKYRSLFNRKFVESEYIHELDQSTYGRLIQSRQRSVDLFREENISLNMKENQLTQEYSEIISNLSIHWDGEKKTIPQMKEYLQVSDRSMREQAWRAIWEAIEEYEDRMQELMSELISIRHEIAQNAGFDNYRDYMFQRYERVDYTPGDCHVFYESVKEHVVPMADQIQRDHQLELGLADYRPWDTGAIAEGETALKPFEDVDQLTAKVIQVLGEVDPSFAHLLSAMREQNLLDLESRSAKSPGGFCSFLPVTGLSFIFMNATGTQGDLVTMIHESGHSVHNQLMQEHQPPAYQGASMEAAELASMSMELLTMDEWNKVYRSAKDLKRAKREQVERTVSIFPWVMVVDQFQHWMYEHPDHTVDERNHKFSELTSELSQHYINTDGLEEELQARWLLQHHIFQAPFYYIDYAIAQLGALQIWQGYDENPEETIKQYKEALSLGSSRSLPEIYETAGIQFDFSEETIMEVMKFVEEQLDSLEK